MNTFDLNSENRNWLEERACLIIPAEKAGSSKEAIELAFRMYGYLEADFLPFHKPAPSPQLAQFTEPVELLQRLRRTYSERIGIEFFPFANAATTQWIEEKFESLAGHIPLSMQEKKHIFELLVQAELFETFLHTKFVGQKRFSLEGAETLIPLLSYIFKTASDRGVDEVVLGMSHRGRLNVLGNIFQKPFEEIIAEFKDMEYDLLEGSGDVKYHKGHTSERSFSSDREMRLTMISNPSHLESVDAVVQGFTRARQKEAKVLSVVIHGDAAVAGQGVVYESLQLSKLKGYSCDGTIHIVLNNHIGFTTLQEESRTTPFCSDIAKTFGIPVFHVNAEDPEVSVWAGIQAVNLQQDLKQDVFIDLNCYRKYGHNESDEPAFTQPLMYEAIRKRPSIRTLFQEKLEIQATQVEDAFREQLKKAHDEARLSKAQAVEKSASPAVSEPSLQELQALMQQLTAIPEGFSLHPQLQKQLKAKSETKMLDWAGAESLAFATLLQAGISIRLDGQDSARGTFSQRHAVWIDQKNNLQYTPFSQFPNASFEVINSPLAEYATLGFEYGYSLGAPNTLVLWEAQFGDFVNGAEIIIDQYIAAGESKWGVECGLTLLLPHGYEGQGPEHSSARMERFLQLAAENNMRIANPTTPVQYYHLLRRQALLRPEKPLIVFTPKGLLRHPDCVSSFESLQQGIFQEIMASDEPAETVIFCQGRVYYDIKDELNQHSQIVRFEQLYPLNRDRLREIIQRKQGKKFLFVQEEPENAGAFRFLKDQIEELLPSGAKLQYIGRKASASPAVASHEMHTKELKAIQEAVRKA